MIAELLAQCRWDRLGTRGLLETAEGNGRWAGAGTHMLLPPPLAFRKATWILVSHLPLFL